MEKKAGSSSGWSETHRSLGTDVGRKEGNRQIKIVTHCTGLFLRSWTVFIFVMLNNSSAPLRNLFWKVTVKQHYSILNNWSSCECVLSINLGSLVFRRPRSCCMSIYFIFIHIIFVSFFIFFFTIKQVPISFSLGECTATLFCCEALDVLWTEFSFWGELSFKTHGISVLLCFWIRRERVRRVSWMLILRSRRWWRWLGRLYTVKASGSLRKTRSTEGLHGDRPKHLLDAPGPPCHKIRVYHLT